jgi:hypothetical protein
VADRFTYTGSSTLGYPAYGDIEAGTMLIAEPGGSYAIRATEPGAPVPPGDGRWGAAQAPPPPASPPPPPPAAGAVAAVTGGTEGGEH